MRCALPFPRTPCDARRRFRAPHAVGIDVSAGPMRCASGPRGASAAPRRTSDPSRYAPGRAPWGAVPPGRTPCGAPAFPRTPCYARMGRAAQAPRLGARPTYRGTRLAAPLGARIPDRVPHAIRIDGSAYPMR